MMNRRNFLLATSAVAVATSHSNFAFADAAKVAQAPISQATMINRSGRLRALSQRTVKAYVQIGLGILPDRSPEILGIAHRLIAGNIAELAAAPLKPDASAQLQTTRTELEKLVSATNPERVSRANFADINKQAEICLQNAESLTSMIEKSSGTHGARIVNIAGRQRLLSQRAAKAYLLHGANVEPNAMAKLLTNSAAEFEAGLRSLENASITNDRIQSQLLLAQSQWGFFNVALKYPYSAHGASDVAKTSERILEVMDTLTGLYETALKDIVG